MHEWGGFECWWWIITSQSLIEYWIWYRTSTESTQSSLPSTPVRNSPVPANLGQSGSPRVSGGVSLCFYYRIILLILLIRIYRTLPLEIVDRDLFSRNSPKSKVPSRSPKPSARRLPVPTGPRSRKRTWSMVLLSVPFALAFRVTHFMIVQLTMPRYNTAFMVWWYRIHLNSKAHRPCHACVQRGEECLFACQDCRAYPTNAPTAPKLGVATVLAALLIVRLYSSHSKGRIPRIMTRSWISLMRSWISTLLARVSPEFVDQGPGC